MEMLIFMDECAKRLAAEIERLGGVTAVAKQIGSVRNTIYNWLEKGNIPLNKLEELKGLGADVVFVLTGQQAVTTLPPDEQMILTRYRASPPELRDAALRVLLGGAVAAPAKGPRYTVDYGNAQIGQATAGDIVNKNGKKK
ncbi:hypothetical protein R0381_002439 [Jeongeupia wiesaeckerbachi]|uniref:hypothetical protein n=1 Tax=Jeongeupia wiesaeckerbachi TaxID=3051218 RepID=UPI003D80958E